MSGNPIHDLLQGAVGEGLFPSYSFLVSEKGEIRSEGAWGLAVVEPEMISASRDTIYDLASLTKPLVTGLLLGILIEKGEVALDDEAGRFLPALLGSDKKNISIRELATHTSGLAAWHPFYLFGAGEDPRKSVLSQIAAMEFAAEKGSAVIYSDLNFMLLSFILEEITDLDFSETAGKYVFEPSGLNNTFFNPDPTLRPRIAACEKGNAHEKKMCRDLFPDIPHVDSGLRDEIIWGVVHDGNCLYLGGAAGHAGLFSTARETHMLALQFLPEFSSLIGARTCKMFQKNLTRNLGLPRSVSFQLAETKDCSAGPELPPDAFGHPGFAGTSVWIDGNSERVYILLTNRTHAAEIPFLDLTNVRRAFNSISARFLEEPQA